MRPHNTTIGSPTQILTRILVRYTTGHRARMKRGWHPYGDDRALSAPVAALLASSLRAQGAEVRLEPVPTT